MTDRPPDRSIALELALDDGSTAFEPGGRISGVAGWTAAAPPHGIELRLRWTSQGAGGRDIKIAGVVALPRPGAAERRPFLLHLPVAPYSFRGKLISLDWALELVAQPGEETVAVPITIAPGRQPLELTHTP